MVVSWPPCWVAVLANTLPTLPISAPLSPQAAGLVEEVAHLRRHVAEAGRRAEDDGVVLGQLAAVRRSAPAGRACGRPWRATSSGTSSGTRLIVTSTPADAARTLGDGLRPSVSTWP